MATLNDFWRDMFGEDVSPFEYNLMVRGAQIMTPEEPLFALFAVMTRILHGTLGETERALLRFGPEISANLARINASAKAFDESLRDISGRMHDIDCLLAAVSLKARKDEPLRTSLRWAVGWAAPLLTATAVFLFCLGFVLAMIIQ